MIEPSGPGSPKPQTPDRDLPRGRTLLLVALIAALVGGGVSAGVTAGVLLLNQRGSQQGVNLGSHVTISESTVATTVAQAAAPAVVSIFTRLPATTQASGFLVTSDGYILTSVSAVAGAQGLVVVVPGESRRYDARLVAADCGSGMALLKVDGVSGLPTLALADSSTVSAGQQVVALAGGVGEPGEVMGGVLRAAHRLITIQDPVGGSTQIQLSDVLLPGMVLAPEADGGPLLNVGGQVVGLLATGSQSGSLVEFALSSNDVKGDVQQVLSGSPLVVPSLGAGTIFLSPEQAFLNGSPDGATITSLDPGGPAGGAGLKVGDVITGIDTQTLNASHPLAQVLRTAFTPSQRVIVNYWRAGQTGQVDLALSGTAASC